jgi:hypothetical protein
MEPLMDRSYKMIAPLVIHAYNNGGRLPYELMPLEPLQPDAPTLGRRSTGGGAEGEREEVDTSAPSPPTPSRGMIIILTVKIVKTVYLTLRHMSFTS